MYESIDWPKPAQPQRRRNPRFLIFVVVIAVILFSSRTALSYWVSLLWFQSLGYGDVFIRTLSLQWAIFTAFSVATFFILYAAFELLKRTHQADLPSDHLILFAGREVNLSVKPVLRIIAVGVSLLIALATGAAMAGQWPLLALWWFAPHVSGQVTDPIFGLPLNFFFLLFRHGISSRGGCSLLLSFLACSPLCFFSLLAVRSPWASAEPISFHCLGEACASQSRSSF